MIGVTVTYPNTPGKRFDQTYYAERHVALVRRTIGASLLRIEIERDSPARARLLSAVRRDRPLLLAQRGRAPGGASGTSARLDEGMPRLHRATSRSHGTG
jgi:hypothetical protein